MRFFSILFGFILFASTLPLWAASPQDYYKTGLQFYLQKQYDQAITSLKEAVQLDPQYWQAYQILGSAYYYNGDKADAIDAVQTSLKIHPDNPALQKFADQLGPAPATPTPGVLVPAATNAISAPPLPVLGASPASATSPKGVSAPATASATLSYHHQGFFLELGGGKNLDADPGFNPTPAGGTIAAGYSFDPYWTLRLQWLEITSESDYIFLTEDRIMPEIKWTPLIGDFQPYFLAGVGLEAQDVTGGAWDSDTYPEQKYIYPDVLMGGGVQTNLKSFVNLFVEIHCNFVFSGSAVGTTTPFLAGLQFDF